MATDTKNPTTGKSRYIIGIDLGTTNCAMSYIDTLDTPPVPRIVEIPQWESDETFVSSETLPSFYYIATKGEQRRNKFKLPFEDQITERPTPANKDFAVGKFARQQASITPDQVIHSAKSWLCHGGINREARILPWHSDEIVGSSRRSPIEVSAAYLDHLRQVWNHHFAAHTPAYRLENQDIVITVPASFDEVAQRLTLEAAELAGIPTKNVKLLEEPQAAFYSWLATNRYTAAEGNSDATLLKLLPNLENRPHTILICDIGGGTSDFSLFEIERLKNADNPPVIKRIAVSDHLLLGGDNIDLGIAYELERRMTKGNGKLNSRQWAKLVFEARRLKERGLSAPSHADDADDEMFVSIAGEGTSLFASTMTASMTSQEIISMIEDGYLPGCPATARPHRLKSGLQEFGLPFAQDSAVTRHIAGFLNGRPIDAVLFTGGTLKPKILQDRLVSIVNSWQNESIVTLDNPQMDLAVALGAAYYGEAVRNPQHKIGGGYARSLYAEVLYSDDTSQVQRHALICVIPKGIDVGEVARIDQLNLMLVTNQPVRFQLYSSNRRPQDQPGDIVNFESETFYALPPLHTKLEPTGHPSSSSQKINVFLEAQVIETGLLEIYCVSDACGGHRWQLSFNLREPIHEAESQFYKDATSANQSVAQSNISPEKEYAARELIAEFYGKKKKSNNDTTSPKTLTRELENLFDLPRERWDIGFLRTFWPELKPGMTRRSRSVAHEVTWLYLSGFCLRPGYGFALDEWRVNELWRAYELGMAHPSERQVEDQWWIMWRRVSGGLIKEQQEVIFDKLFPLVRKGDLPSPEAFRLIASLEHVDVDKKIKLGNGLVSQITSGKKQFIQDKIWALARIASRVPLYSGPETILRPIVVETWLNQLKHLDCKNKFYKNLTLLYAQSGRLVNDRELDLPDHLRLELIERLVQCHADPNLILPLKQVTAVDEEARNRLFGETLPSGLYLDLGMSAVGKPQSSE